MAAATGLSEKAAREENLDAAVLYMPGQSHAGYYPGAKPLLLKLVYETPSGRILGAQAVGGDGADKRIDVIATAIQGGMTVEDLEHLDLSYAPPFGSAKDLEIQAGFAASNDLRGVMPLISPQALIERLQRDEGTVLDVRTLKEYEAGHLDEAIHIPVDELRQREDEVPSDGPLYVHCAGGYRSYVAQRMLMNRGRSDVYNVTGGWNMLQRIRKLTDSQPE
jgi:rhodanese-related sulfurtransferase